MEQLSPVTSRFAAVGLLLLMVSGLVLYGLVPMVNAYSDRADQVAMQGKRLETMRNLLANQNQVEEGLKRLETLNNEGEIFFKGVKPAIASAKLRELVSDMVKDSGGALVSTQEYETEPLDTASSIGLRLQFTGDTDNLADFLFRLENARPLIFVEDLSVTSTLRRAGARTVSAARARARARRASLSVTLNIFGYMVAEGDV